MLMNALKIYGHVTIVFEIKTVKKYIFENAGQERLDSFFAAMITKNDVLQKTEFNDELSKRSVWKNWEKIKKKQKTFPSI